MMAIPLIFIGLFALFFFYSNKTQTLSQENLNAIKNHHFPLMELATKNIEIFNTIEKSMKDAVSAKESLWIDATLQQKEEMLNNFSAIDNYLLNKSETQASREMFLAYYSAAKKLSKKIIEENMLFSKETEKLMYSYNKKKELSIASMQRFKKEQLKDFHNRLNSTNEKLQETLLFSTIGAIITVVIILVITLLIAIPIKKNLNSIINAINALAQAKPNFSNLINSNTHDEIEELVKSFNTFSLKMKKDYSSLSDTLVELQKTQEKLKEAKQKAEKATQSKSLFLANMSHEIRTPMNSIIGMTYFALQTDLTYKQKEYVTKASNAAKSLLNIINDILDFSKIEAGKLDIHPEKADVKEILLNVYSNLEYQAIEKNLHFELSTQKLQNSKVLADALRLTQVLTNLISNAIKFTDSGSIKVFLSQKDSLYRFEIKDTGIGLTHEQINSLFQSFTQADESTTKEFGGTGLGLAISKQLVELMSGKIWVDSVKNKGSSFIFELPLTISQKKMQIDSTILKGATINTSKTLITQKREREKHSISLKDERVLLQELEQALSMQVPFEVEPLILKLQNTQLSTLKDDAILKVVQLSSKYRFQEALEVLHNA